jgi:hypothetical protein
MRVLKAHFATSKRCDEEIPESAFVDVQEERWHKEAIARVFRRLIVSEQKTRLRNVD